MYIKIHFINRILYKDINMHVNLLYVSINMLESEKIG
jgi:hypothetical protein